MGAIRDQANIVYANGPSANPTEPNKADIRELFRLIDEGVAAAAVVEFIDGGWQTSTAYTVNQALTHNDVVYRCIADHTSGSTTEPGVGADWETVWEVMIGAIALEDGSVENAKLADMDTASLKGRATAGSGEPEDLTAAQVRTILNVEDGATANSSDATLLARANHTGTQSADTLVDGTTNVVYPATDKAIVDKVWIRASSAAAASTVDLIAVQGDQIDITGNGTIESFGGEVSSRRLVKLLRFSGSATIKYAADKIITPGNVDLVVTPGSFAIVQQRTNTVWAIISFQHANGLPLSSERMRDLLGVEAEALAAFRASLWSFYGDGSPSEIPIEVSEDNRVLTAIDGETGELVVPGIGGGAAAGEEVILGYVETGALRAIGGAGADRLVNDDAGRTWMHAVARGSSIQAMFEDGASERHLVRVSPDTGDIYYDGELTLLGGGGQSNAEGAAGEAREAIRTEYPFPERLQMPETPSANIWLGMTTSGTSIELDGNDVTGLMPLTGSLSPVGTCGTTQIESAALRRAQRAHDDCGYVPRLCVWVNAEGGTTIEQMLENPPDPDDFYFANFVTVITRIQALKPANLRAVYRWEFFNQGEGNSSATDLGDNHDLLRSQMEAQAQSILGQTEPLRMLSVQPSSFFGNGAGARSILQYALDNEAPFGNFWCLGPTYHLPFSADLLHMTSLGHDMLGEEYEIAAMAVERTGAWQPLHAVSASITGANEITVTLSEAAVIDDSGPVAAIANAGIAVFGKTVTGVNVSGTALTITTDEAAAGATSVQIGMTGHSGTRDPSTAPRTNVRSADGYGNYRSGSAVRKWLCHQQINIT